MLIDTDVLIWYLRGNTKAKAAIDALTEFSISAVTYMEILQGLRNQHEFRAWHAFMKEHKIKNILIDEEITSKAIFWMEEFTFKHHLRMADALIASTATSYGKELLTGNVKDYKFLPGLTIHTFKAN